MADRVRLAVIGAGPAGLAAAAEAARCGVEVLLIDEQKAAGGQIYRAIERANGATKEIFGAEYRLGESLVKEINAPTVTHLNGATVWQVTPEREIYLTKDGISREVTAECIIIATGAMERPMPFPGWTLPGVMTAGAGQVLLKTAGLIPKGELILAGSGPLLLLVAAQFLRAGGGIGAIVETTPRGNYLRAARYLPAAIRDGGFLRKGMVLLREIGKHNIPHYKGASNLEAAGHGKVETLRFNCRNRQHELPCSTLMLHMGIVPNVQITRSLNLNHEWNALQRCWRPRRGEFGETEIEGLMVAGDGGGIGGAMVAEIEGRMAGLRAAVKLGAIGAGECRPRLDAERRKRSYHLAARPFIDALYTPSREFLSPPDDTVVCRCEEVTAGQIREYVGLGCLGPNQAKSFGRSGMGPCQGRFCGLTVSEIIAEERDKPLTDIGYYRIRPPIKPVTLGELAAMHESGDAARANQEDL